METIQS